MDPQACLDILSRAAREHQRLEAQGGDQCHACRRAGPARPQQCAVAGAIAAATSAADASEIGSAKPTDKVAPEGGELTPPFLPPPRAVADVTIGGGEGAGQLINLETGQNETVQKGMTEAAILELFPALLPQPGIDAPREGSAEDVSTPTPADLALAAVQLHEARVAVHNAYDGAFRYLLKEKGGGPKALARTYPSVVARATARFQVLSESARAVAASLEAAAAKGSDSVQEAAALVRRVQGLEQARLQLVAMHHIEQSQLHTRGGGNAANCSKIRQQLGSTAEEIEEAVSELRYCVAELREEVA